jgi:hypothetical protein
MKALLALTLVLAITYGCVPTHKETKYKIETTTDEFEGTTTVFVPEVFLKMENFGQTLQAYPAMTNNGITKEYAIRLTYQSNITWLGIQKVLFLIDGKRSEAECLPPSISINTERETFRDRDLIQEFKTCPVPPELFLAIAEGAIVKIRAEGSNGNLDGELTYSGKMAYGRFISAYPPNTP